MTELEAINNLCELVPDWFRKETTPIIGTFFQVRFVTRTGKHAWHTLGDTTDLFNAEHLLVNLTAFADSRGWRSSISYRQNRPNTPDPAEVTLEFEESGISVNAATRSLALAIACVMLLKELYSKIKD